MRLPCLPFPSSSNGRGWVPSTRRVARPFVAGQPMPVRPSVLEYDCLPITCGRGTLRNHGAKPSRLDWAGFYGRLPIEGDEVTRMTRRAGAWMLVGLGRGDGGPRSRANVEVVGAFKDETLGEPCRSCRIECSRNPLSEWSYLYCVRSNWPYRWNFSNDQAQWFLLWPRWPQIFYKKQRYWDNIRVWYVGDMKWRKNLIFIDTYKKLNI